MKQRQYRDRLNSLSNVGEEDKDEEDKDEEEWEEVDFLGGVDEAESYGKIRLD